MAKKTHSLPIVVACGLILTAGCDWLRPGGPPEEAYVEISTDDVDELTIIISQLFLQVEDPECAGQQGCSTSLRIITADTIVASSPYTNNITFTNTLQLYVETYPTDEVEATVAMKVDIDGKEWFDDLRLVRPMTDDGARDALRFVYQFGFQQQVDDPFGGGP